ncbi:hypothetical protein COO60DRAFT_1684851 [Scenedesmus sp. NREL 46B-D3]|nr:hypothetical protein COO60DRAFT_1684851 [Scenedesmus sp. NREL 46B-D3]
MPKPASPLVSLTLASAPQGDGSLPTYHAACGAEALQKNAATPGQAPAEGAAGRLDRKLTSMLADCTSWQDVAAVLAAADSTGRLNGVHVAAAAATLARLAAAERASATAGDSAAADAQPVLSGIVPQSKQQRMRMRVVRKAVSAAAAAGWHSKWHPPDSQPGAAPVAAAAAEQLEGSAAAAAGVEQATAAAEAALLAASGAALRAGAAEGAAQGLAVQAWALVRLGVCPPPSWLAAWLAAMWAALPAATSHDCAMGAWAVARLGIAPPGDWLAALCSRAGQLAARLGPQELPPLLWALARLRYRPQLHVAQALLLRGAVLAAAGQLSPQGLALLLWAPAGLGLAPRGAWLGAVLAAAAAYLPLFRAAEASALLVGLVRLQHIPGGPWLVEWWAHTAGMLPYAHGRQLVALLWGAVQLGQAPPAAWMRAWQAASARAMAAGQVSSRGYGIMWAALQQLEVRLPASWLGVYWHASSQPHGLHGLDCLAAERSLAGLAAVSRRLPEGLGPPRRWAAAFLAASQQLLQSASTDNIAGMLAAAGELQLALPRPWLAAAMARLAELLAVQGVISPISAVASSGGNKDSSSINGGGARAHPNLSLAARLQRRRVSVQLQRVLAGLRAQQMLAAPNGYHANLRSLCFFQPQQSTAACACSCFILRTGAAAQDLLCKTSVQRFGSAARVVQQVLRKGSDGLVLIAALEMACIAAAALSSLAPARSRAHTSSSSWGAGRPGFWCQAAVPAGGGGGGGKGW